MPHFFTRNFSPTLLTLPKSLINVFLGSKWIISLGLTSIGIIPVNVATAQPINVPPVPGTVSPSKSGQYPTRTYQVPSNKPALGRDSLKVNPTYSTSSSQTIAAPSGPIVDSLPPRLSPAKLAYTFYPLAIVAANFMLGMEKPISAANSLKGMISYGISETPRYYAVESYAGYYGEAQIRHYLSKEALRGFYYGGYTAGRYTTYTYKEVAIPSSRLTIGASQFAARFGLLMGVQVPIRQIIPLDVYVGFGPQFIFGDDTDLESATPIDSYNEGVILHAGFAFGLYKR